MQKVQNFFNMINKAKFAVEQTDWEKWMQECHYWDDVANPLGNRMVAYAMYLMLVYGFTVAEATSRSLKFIKE